MLFFDEELTNRQSFKKAVIGLLTSGYTNEEEPKEELYEEIGKATESIRAEILAAIDKLPDNVFPINELEMPTLWIETNDAYDMAGEGDFSGIKCVLQDLLNWLKRQR